MANNKKRELREKKDTILKMFILSDTMHLTNEEFGALIRIVMIEDDRKDKRYEEMKGFVLNEFKKKEQEWKKSFDELTEKNKTMISAFSTVFGQANKSHTSFLILSKQYENDYKDNTEGTQGDLKDEDTGTPTGTENPTESDLEDEHEQLEMEYEYNDEIIAKAVYERKYLNNLPWPEQIYDFLENKIYDIEKVKRIIDFGNAADWEEEWTIYAKEIENEK